MLVVPHNEVVSSGKSLHLSLTSVSKHKETDLHLKKSSRMVTKHYIYYSHFLHLKYFRVFAYKTIKKPLRSYNSEQALNLLKVQYAPLLSS